MKTTLIMALVGGMVAIYLYNVFIVNGLSGLMAGIAILSTCFGIGWFARIATGHGG